MESDIAEGRLARQDETPSQAEPGDAGSRPRLAAAEVRHRLLEKAGELVEAQDAFSIELDMRMEDLIRRADVPRSSAFRVWPHREQFTADVLEYLAGRSQLHGHAIDAKGRQDAQQTVQDNQHLLATVPGRRKLTYLLVRTVVDSFYRSMTESTWWRHKVALLASARFVDDEDARARIARALETGDQQLIKDNAEYYALMALILGLELRPPLTHEQFALVTAAQLEGLAVREIMVSQAAIGRDPRTNTDVWSLGELLNSRFPLPRDLHLFREDTDATEAPDETEWSLPTIMFLITLDAFYRPVTLVAPGESRDES